MAEGQPVAEFREQLASIFGGVGMRNAVVQMDFDFSPAGMAVSGEHFEQDFVVLLGGIEVGMDKRAAIVVAPEVDDFGIFARPQFQATLPPRPRGALPAVLGNDGGVGMIGP